MATDTEITTLRFPRRLLEGRIRRDRPVEIRVFETDNGWRAALGIALTEVSDRDCGGARASTFADHMIGLLDDTTRREPAAGNREATFRRLRLDLRANLRDRELDLAGFAKRHRMSTRTLQSLFHSAGTCFSDELQRLRLEHAAEMLADTDFSQMSVAEVAFAAGFSNPSHFGRRFRGAYGVSPGEYRAAALERKPGSVTEPVGD